MKTNLFCSLFFITGSLFLLIQFGSCKKDNNARPAEITGSKDSSLLIKSIRYASKYVEDYYYDSINNKIILTSVTDDTSFPSSSKSELSYNEKHLLTGIVRKFKPDNSPDSSIDLTVTIDYDDQNVVTKIEERDFYGAIKSTVFTKTLLASGQYELKWLEPGGQAPNGTRLIDTLQAVFNDSGRIITRLTNSPYPVSGTPDDTLTTATITKDTFVFDNQGSLMKVLTNYVDTLRNIDDSFTYYQFSSRLNTGDNLFNQRQLLMRGISNIPFSTTIFSDEVGVLSIFNDIEAFEYSKYPFQSILIHDYSNNNDVSFTPVTEFDSKGRLTYFKGFTLLEPRPGVVTYPLDYRITYFK